MPVSPKRPKMYFQQLYCAWNDTPEDDSIIIAYATAKECAARLGISVNTLYQECSRRKHKRGNRLKRVLVMTVTELESMDTGEKPEEEFYQSKEG